MNLPTINSELLALIEERYICIELSLDAIFPGTTIVISHIQRQLESLADKYNWEVKDMESTFRVFTFLDKTESEFQDSSYRGSLNRKCPKSGITGTIVRELSAKYIPEHPGPYYFMSYTHGGSVNNRVSTIHPFIELREILGEANISFFTEITSDEYLFYLLT